MPKHLTGFILLPRSLVILRVGFPILSPPFYRPLSFSPLFLYFPVPAYLCLPILFSSMLLFPQLPLLRLTFTFYLFLPPSLGPFFLLLSPFSVPQRRLFPLSFLQVLSSHFVFPFFLLLYSLFIFSIAPLSIPMLSPFPTTCFSESSSCPHVGNEHKETHYTCFCVRFFPVCVRFICIYRFQVCTDFFFLL